MTTDDVLAAWTADLTEALGLPEGSDIDISQVLDLARDAAHGVARPAAPLTTFLVGYASGLRGGGPSAVSDAVDTATRLATAKTKARAEAEDDQGDRAEG